MDGNIGLVHRLRISSAAPTIRENSFCDSSKLPSENRDELIVIRDKLIREVRAELLEEDPEDYYIVDEGNNGNPSFYLSHDLGSKLINYPGVDEGIILLFIRFSTFDIVYINELNDERHVIGSIRFDEAKGYKLVNFRFEMFKGIELEESDLVSALSILRFHCINNRDEIVQSLHFNHDNQENIAILARLIEVESRNKYRKKTHFLLM